MALKEGKRTVKLKASVADNIGIPKFPNTNIAAEIAKPLSDIADTFRKTAEADMKIDWQYNFNQKSRDHYLDLRNKYKDDPDGMRNAVDTYSKTTLANTPPVFRSIAENVLAQKNLANLSFATTNYENKKTEELQTGWEVTKSDFFNDTSMHLDTLIASDNLSAMDINSDIGNKRLVNLNHNYGTMEETGVGTQRYKGSKLKKDLDNDIIELEALRVFSIMKKIGDVDGQKYFTNYAAGNDNLPVTPDNVNNPIFQKYTKDINNPFTRNKIITKVKSLYNDFRGKNISDLKSATIKYDLDGLQDAGSILDVHNFRDGAGNASNWVINNMPNISSTDLPKAIDIVDKNIKAQILASKALDKEIILNYENDEQKELVKKALFRRFGINDMKITDANKNAFANAMEILKNQNLEPTAVVERLNRPYNVNFKTPGMIDAFEENLRLYNFIKSKDMFPYLPIKNEHIYIDAEADGLASMANNELKAERLNRIVGDTDFNKNKQLIETHLKENVQETTDGFAWAIRNLNINTDTFWLKKIFTGGKNKYAHLFIPESTTLLPFEAKLDPEAYDKWLSTTINELAHLNGGKSIDIKSADGKRLFYKGAIQALNTMNREGYGATRLNGTGKVTITKNAFEDKVGFTGTGFDNAVMAQGKYLQNNLSEREQIERFGSFIKGGSTKEQPIDVIDIIKTEIDNGYKNTIVEPTDTMNKYGQPNYHLKIINDDRIINLTQGDNYFDPTGLGSNVIFDNKLPATRNQLINNIAKERYDRFMNKFGGFFDGDSKVEGWIQKFLLGTAKLKIEASDYKFYPDFPGIKDVPAEVKPFGFIFEALGQDVSLDKYYEEGAKINNEIQELISYDAEIEANSRIEEKDKMIESIYPPHKISYTEQNIQLGFRQHVYKNYQDKSLPLTFRTNNYMAVMKTDQTWQGEITDIFTGNQAAIFASPVDSIRAGIRVMINNSTLSSTDTTKRYGDTPTIEEILSSYAEDTNIYLTALEEKTDFTRDDVINFFDTNQMMKFIKFMIEHEMGSEPFNQYYPPGSLTIDAMILEGYKQGINSYGGKLGKPK